MGSNVVSVGHVADTLQIDLAEDTVGELVIVRFDLHALKKRLYFMTQIVLNFHHLEVLTSMLPQTL